MGRGRDGFWEYAEDLKGRFLCKFCGLDFSGGSTRIKSHLSGLNRRDIVICSKVPEDVQLAARQAITAPEKKLGKLRSLNNDGETQVISISAPNKKAKSLHQPTILGECKKDKSVVDKMFAKFFISSNITLEVAKMRCLVDLLRSVAEFGPSYEIPNISALTSQLIPGIFEEVEEHVGNVKKLFTTTGCTLHFVEGDLEILCINAFAYTPAGIIYVGKIAYSEQGMSFSYLMNRIYSIIASLGPENVVQCIFDIYRIKHRLTDFEVDDIFLSIHDMVCKKYPWILMHQNDSNPLYIYILFYTIDKMTELAADIFRYLHKHDFNLLPQRDHTSDIKEYSASRVVTKMAVKLFVLRTILEFEKELQARQLPIATESCEGPSREIFFAEIVDEAIHSTEYWTRCKKVVQVLRALFPFLKFIYGNGSNIGYLYEASKRTEEAIKQQCDGDDHEKIIKLFEDWKRERIKPVHAAAAFLNPAYFWSEKFTEDTHEMERLLTPLVPTEEQDALSKQLQLYSMKVSDLFSAAAMENLNTIHPRKWWECFGHPCPILQKLAVRILSQPYSTPFFPNLVNFQPNGWLDKLRMNTILMENFKPQNSEPIHLTSEDPDYAYEDVLKFLDEDYLCDDDVRTI